MEVARANPALFFFFFRPFLMLLQQETVRKLQMLLFLCAMEEDTILHSLPKELLLLIQDFVRIRMSLVTVE